VRLDAMNSRGLGLAPTFATHHFPIVAVSHRCPRLVRGGYPKPESNHEVGKCGRDGSNHDTRATIRDSQKRTRPGPGSCSPRGLASDSTLTLLSHLKN